MFIPLVYVVCSILELEVTPVQGVTSTSLLAILDIIDRELLRIILNTSTGEARN